MAITSNLRPQRLARSLTQTQLAKRVGVTRQALAAVEAGRQVPSTKLALTLARALSCTVEDLFALEGPKPVSARGADGRLNVGSRVFLGEVGGQWAAHIVGEDRCAADGIVTAVTGSNVVVIEPIGDPTTSAMAPLLVAGCAPLLGLATERLVRSARQVPGARWICANSGRALQLLADDLVHIAGVHFVTADTDGGHSALVKERLPERDHTIVHLARWRQGLVVAAGNPLGIRELSDIERSDVRFVAREVGSGASGLLKRLLPTYAVSGASAEASSHADVARLVQWGLADAGIAIESSAGAHGLDFVPLSEERFDLVLVTHRIRQPAIERFLGLLSDKAFGREARAVPGYDLGLTGSTTQVQAGR